jgi:hypothetical protein
MLGFQQMKLTEFSFVHASAHDHVNQERHPTGSRETHKNNRSAALAEWRTIMT